MATGWRPTLIGLPGLRVAMVIGVTVPEPKFSTNAFMPFGGIAIAPSVSPPVLITGPILLVATVIGVTPASCTEASPTTYAVRPFGVIAIAYGNTAPNRIGRPARFEAVAIGVTAFVVTSVPPLPT